tara:strand:- start:3331 stop:3633 length:303 start_codon:yes stop_codon:yes gene_type:complete
MLVDNEDKQFINALNELLELIESISPHIDENEYLKACNNLKILHNYKDNKKYFIQQQNISYFPHYPQMSLWFMSILWMLSLSLSLSLLLFAPNVSYIAGT